MACCGLVLGWNIGSGKLALALNEVYAEALGVVREKDNETVLAVLERLRIGMPGSKKGDREGVAATVGHRCAGDKRAGVLRGSRFLATRWHVDGTRSECLDKRFVTWRAELRSLNECLWVRNSRR